MENVILVIHLILALSIIGLVMLQRSEGGGLGIGGGGGGMGSLASVASTKNLLTKATSICALLFFCTSLILGILAGGHSSSSVVDSLDNVTLSIDSEGETGDNKIPEAENPDSTNTPVPSAPIAE